MEAEEDAAAKAELGMPPCKRRRGAAGKGEATRRRRAAKVEAPEVRQPVRVAAAAARMMEVDDVAGKAGTARRRVCKGDKPKEVGADEAPRTMEVHDAACTAIGDADVCAEEPDAEELRMDEEEEEAAALEAEELAMRGAGSAGATKRVARPRATERTAVDGAASEDHFVGELVQAREDSANSHAGVRDLNLEDMMPEELQAPTEADEGSNAELGPGPSQPKRMVRKRLPNRRYTGPEWTR